MVDTNDCRILWMCHYKKHCIASQQLQLAWDMCPEASVIHLEGNLKEKELKTTPNDIVRYNSSESVILCLFLSSTYFAKIAEFNGGQ